MPPPEFFSQPIILGVGGLDLHRTIDQIQPIRLSRMTNLRRTQEGALSTRPGQTSLFTTAETNIHSTGRVDSVLNDDFQRVVGAGLKLFCGKTGALLEVDTGYSGESLSMVPLRPPLSGDAWMYVGDSKKMRKVRASDCLDLPVGFPITQIWGEDRFRLDEFGHTPDGTLSARDRTRLSCFGFDVIDPPAGATFAVLSAEKKVSIDTFETAGWTNNTGTGPGAPSNAVSTDAKQGTNSVKFSTATGTKPFHQFWNKAFTLDLSSFSDGTPVEDEDIIHLWLKVSRPDRLSEVRLYFVCSSAFSTTVLPGTDATSNKDAYFKSFRPFDFTSMIEAAGGPISAVSNFNEIVQAFNSLAAGGGQDSRSLVQTLREQIEALRAASVPLAPGRGEWTEYGVIGLPLRRGDFQRIGGDASRDWSGVTGIVVMASFTTGTNDVFLDDLHLTGGSGPDTSEFGAQPYDWRYRDYDPRTGTKGNPSPVQTLHYHLDPIRRAVRLRPMANGDSKVRQQFFRRGGTLVNNWYFLGENGADGGDFIDTLTDTQIQAAGTLEIDNDQPVTTHDSKGTTIRGQPLPAIWEVNGALFGCGDPHRPGHVYWSKFGEFDHWPAVNNQEVSTPSDEMMAGVNWAGHGMCFSRAKGYNIYVNLAGPGTVTILPSGCQHGLISRKAVAVGIDGVYFVSNDGVYRTTGGPETNISDDDLRPIFHGEARNGYQPIDFTVPNTIKIAVHDSELWLLYQDTAGDRQVLIYSIPYRYWRAYDFGREINSAFSEKTTAAPLLVLGGRATGAGYTHSGLTDDGLAIAFTGRTGALDQGLPRQEKLYGDLFLDLDRAGAAITITPFINNEATALAAQTINSGSGRARYYADVAPVAGQGPVLARNVSIELSGTVSVAPIFHVLGPSFTAQVDDTTLRVTEWSAQGRLVDKIVKGVLIECDTLGVNKLVDVEADGVLRTTLTVNASGRRVEHFAFTQFRGRLLRLRPTGTGAWKLYSYRWIFDEEPVKLTRWETQRLNHGTRGYKTPLYGYFTLESIAQVDITITVVREDGTTQSIAASIPSTVGAKKPVFVGFTAAKGVLLKYLLTSIAAFWLYREESSIALYVWNTGETITVHPFGNDDLDLARGMADAEGVAMRTGGGA